MCSFLFFKQKTAYEMRISDWSSDVCSSDLKYRARFGKAPYRLSTLGYDVVLLTVRLARDWKPGTAFPEPRLRDDSGFSGIDGAFRFGRDGVAQRALEVQEIRGGRTVTVSAAPKGFGK